MSRSLKPAFKFLSLALALIVTLSCSVFTPGQMITPTPPPTPSPPPTALPSLTPLPKPTASLIPTPLPIQTSTAVPAIQVDNIAIDYLYTSELITVLYPLYGSLLDDFVIMTITNTNQLPAKIVVTSEITGYTTQAIDTVDVGPGETVEVRQNPRLIPEMIDQLNMAKPAEVHVKVNWLDNGVEKLMLDQTNETLVYARRDFPWSIKGFTEPEIFDMMAALVTPNDPAVEALLRKAADYNPSGSMSSGYGGVANDENNSVYNRLKAIWEAEAEAYKLTYISTMITFAPGSVQRIRLPYETLEQQSGNCIELVVLFAAAAEALGLDAAIIGIPGHAYAAVRTDDQNSNYYFIETTLINGSSFDDALAYGSKEWGEAKPHVEAGESGYGWVSINDARAKGILPLPVH